MLIPGLSSWGMSGLVTDLPFTGHHLTGSSGDHGLLHRTIR
jgi:hypothetical protein